MRFAWRNIPLLALAQALGLSGASMMVFLGGIAGSELAPARTMATLPSSLMVVGVAATAVPAALVMQRWGRKTGFILGALLGTSGALLAAGALRLENFFLFCAGAALIGANNAFIYQYRFAAAESAGVQGAARAVSFVLLGGIAAGFLGPQVATWAQALLPGPAYSGSFVVLAGMLLITAALHSLLANPTVIEGEHEQQPVSVMDLARRPLFLLAVISAAVAYGSMSFIMTATPVQMHTLGGFDLQQTAWVIESHIAAMYLPSLFTGLILERFGVVRVMAAGALAILACALVGAAAVELLHYWWALVLLGIGWNFLFVGSTVLLTRSYTPPERFRAQAVNEFSVFAIQAFTALSAGSALFMTNWKTLNLLNVPFLLLTLGILLAMRRRIASEVPQP